MDSFIDRFSQYWRKANQWYYRTADRALDEAYKAALKIKAIEDEHFGGKQIEIDESANSSQVATYFQNDLNKYLRIARLRLAEFQTSRTVTGNNYPRASERQQFDPEFNSLNPYTQDIEREARVLEKLSFIDEVLTRYAQTEPVGGNGIGGLLFDNNSTQYAQDAIDVMPDGERGTLPLRLKDNASIANPDRRKPALGRRQTKSMSDLPENSQENLNKKAIIDPSLIRTFQRIQQDLNPKAEAQVVENYRFSQGKTRTALRYLLLLILLPLLVQYISKIIVFGPAIDLYRTQRHADIFLNVNLEEEALAEMERFERGLKFKQLVGLAPNLSPTQVEEKLVEKAEEIKKSFYRQSAEAVKNWFADVVSILTFSWLIVNGKQQIAVLKSFIDDIISGLSDTAKAFVIILITDTFVGFHSPHGWEVILQVVSKHLGIPENREFNSLFIATFPVLIDTIFKYWIFRYLSGRSPSAVATFKTMNE